MTTLNKFNDDDDFMGNFDEDGSFIGNYDEYNEEQAQAVQNKLLVFQQMYRANNGALWFITLLLTMVLLYALSQAFIDNIIMFYSL